MVNYTVSHTPDFAVEELESGDFGNADSPVVVKADGLAAGKGVVVAANRSEGIAAIRGLAGIAGPAAAKDRAGGVLDRQRSVFADVCERRRLCLLMPPAMDHKRLGDGDTGPNTGGMGTFTDVSLLDEQQLQNIIDTIVRPTLRGCIREGFPFRGVLFLGLMMTAAGPRLLEYNVRFGDPETQSILVRLETDLLEICGAMLTNKPLNDLNIKWRGGSSACVVLASR